MPASRPAAAAVLLSATGPRVGQVDYLIWWTAGMSVPPLVTEGNADV